MLRQLSYRQLMEWQTFDSLEPVIGPERGDYQAAIICASVANLFSAATRGKGKQPKVFRVGDFLLDFKEGVPETKSVVKMPAGKMHFMQSIAKALALSSKEENERKAAGTAEKKVKRHGRRS